MYPQYATLAPGVLSTPVARGTVRQRTLRIHTGPVLVLRFTNRPFYVPLPRLVTYRRYYHIYYLSPMKSSLNRFHCQIERLSFPQPCTVPIRRFGPKFFLWETRTLLLLSDRYTHSHDKVGLKADDNRAFLTAVFTRTPFPASIYSALLFIIILPPTRRARIAVFSVICGLREKMESAKSLVGTVNRIVELSFV